MKVAWLPASLRKAAQCPACSPRLVAHKFSPLPRLISPASAKSFSTSSQSQDIAAPEVDFSQTGNGVGAGANGMPNAKIRLVPESASYFTAQPRFIDDLISLQALLRKHATLPTVKPSEAPRVAWQTLVDYRNSIGETVNASKYHKIVQILQRLNQIHPSVMPVDIKAEMQYYIRAINPQSNKTKVIPIDRFGRAVGTGRRKASTARAWVVEGNGEFLVNGKPLTEAFGRVHDRESAIWALKATERVDKYNIWALVEGGGTTGQAEAMTLAVAKALMAHEPLLKPALRRAGCITRDPRRVERKKPGHLKARKMPQWVKR